MTEPRLVSPQQQSLIERLADELEQIRGVEGIALGGSHARGAALADSDIDLGIYYRDAVPLDVAAIRDLAGRVSKSVPPVASELYEWGPWVNGGAWLTIDEQRVDLLYRSLDHLERTIGDARAGKHELHFGQQPPFGFFSGTYLGELEIAVVVRDSAGHIQRLKEGVGPYPEALRKAVVQDYLWSVDFGLRAFASKFAQRDEVFLTTSTLARSAYALVLVLFALNRHHLVNDKTALQQIMDFPLHPERFRERVERLLGNTGTGKAELANSVSEMQSLFSEVAVLAGDLYQARYQTP